MGNDGGVLAMQRKFMRGLGNKMGEKASEEISKRFKALMRLNCCAVSNEQLRDPIVACELGHLYNKEAVLMALLERTLNPAFNHIRGMKDLIPCRLTLNPNWKDEAEAGSSSTSSEAKGEAAAAAVATAVQVDEKLVPKYICPVTRAEMNAKQPFVIIRTTGWVLSDRALREIGAANLQQEYGPFEADDVIRLVPEEEEEKDLRTRMHERRAKAKKEKKRKREAEGGGEKEEKEKEKTGKDWASASEGAEGKDKKKEKHKDKAAVKSNGNGSHHQMSTAPMGIKSSSLAAEAKKAADKEMANSSSFASLFNSGNEKTDKNRLFSVRR